ncbi:hypothetical protein [Streptomyces fractus]|uniref:hypothetical protein n=1 Tax=Streptomyces fractus TaxID=641806 RepID=UPI003CFAC0F2
MEAKLKHSDPPHSRSKIHAAFTGTRLPDWDLIQDLLQILGDRHRVHTPEELLPAWDELWQAARTRIEVALERERSQHESATSTTSAQPLTLPRTLQNVGVNKHCSVCNAFMPHQRLNKQEQEYVFSLTGRTDADALAACANCRTVRHYFSSAAIYPGPERLAL